MSLLSFVSVILQYILFQVKFLSNNTQLNEKKHFKNLLRE